MFREIIDEAIILPLSNVVEVLHAYYRRNLLCLSELPGANIAHPEMTNQSLSLKFGEHRQWLFDGFFRRLNESSDPQVHDIKNVEPEIAQIVMDGIDQFPTRQSMRPGLVGSLRAPTFVTITRPSR